MSRKAFKVVRRFWRETFKVEHANARNCEAYIERNPGMWPVMMSAGMARARAERAAYALACLAEMVSQEHTIERARERDHARWRKLVSDTLAHDDLPIVRETRA